MKLSILVCSTNNRYKTFLPKILDQLFGQLDRLPSSNQKEVEVLTLIDNKTIMLGTKRNNLIDISSGEYIVFVDDDDRVANDYIEQLLKATASGADVITFLVMVSLNGEEPKPCYYSKNYENDFNTNEGFHRLPNHIMCVKRELAEVVKFKPVLYGEDSDYSKRLKPLLSTQHNILKPLYYYDYNIETTEAQEYQRKRKSKSVCDVVILSNAKSSSLLEMTQKCIRSLVTSEREGVFNIIVIEQQPDIKYSGATTIHLPGEFNYNRFANIGVSKGASQWLCITNNDVLFRRHWFYHLLKVKAPVMSSKNPGDKRHNHITMPTAGTEVGVHFTGWCFVMKRTIWDEIGGLDEDFPFWCADNATVEQLDRVNIEPVLVPDSHVEHLGSSTLNTLDKQLRDELTSEQVRKFNRKYNKNLFNLGV